MSQSFSGGSNQLREAIRLIDQKVKWTVRMSGEALTEVDELIGRAGALGSNIQGINMAKVASQDVRASLGEAIGKLNRLKEMLDQLA